MWKILKWLVIIVVLIFIGGLIKNVLVPNAGEPAGVGQGTSPTTTLAIKTRHFQMGFVPIPAQPLSQATWLSAFDLFGQSAEVIMQHRHFAASEAASLDLVAQLAKTKNLKLFVVIDPLSDNREKLDPTLLALGPNFADAKVRAEYQRVAKEVVQKYEPAYLSFGSEMNTYLAKHPADLAAYQSLVKETAEAVKSLAPATKTTISFQYETLSGAYGAAQWPTLAALEPLIDEVAFTTYPNIVYKRPSDIPANYYTALKDHTSKKLIVAESGWPSNKKSDDQSAFLARFSTLINALPVDLWVWWFPHDWGSSGYGSAFANMGLRTSSGDPKPAWRTWQKIFNLPR